jgi:hypothetical protein
MTIAVVFPRPAKGLIFVPRRQSGALGQVRDSLAKFRHVLATPLRQFGVTPKLGTSNHISHAQIPRSLKSASGVLNRFPSPRSAACIALTVVALGTLTRKGNAFSAATRTSRIRTASETDMPIAASVFAALFFTFSSTRMCTIVVAMSLEPR